MEEQGKFFDDKELEKMWVMDFDRWRDSGVKLRRTQGKGEWYISQLSWAIGDWLLAGKEQASKKRAGKKWGSMKEVRHEALAIWKKPWGTLKNYMGLAKEFPKKSSRRRDNLSWSHHNEVRKLSVEEQEKYLNACTDGKTFIWSVKGLRSKIRNDKKTGEGFEQADSVPLVMIVGTSRLFGERARSTRTLKLTSNEAEALDFILSTEKQVHRKSTIEELVYWLYLRGWECTPGWLDKAKEYVKSQRAKKQTNREALEAAARAKGTSPKPKESPTPSQHPAVSPAAPETFGYPSGDLPPGVASPVYRAFTERCSKIVREVLSKTDEPKNGSYLLKAYLLAESGKSRLADITTNQWAAMLDTVEAASADPYELLKILKTDREAAKPEPVTV